MCLNILMLHLNTSKIVDLLFYDFLFLHTIFYISNKFNFAKTSYTKQIMSFTRVLDVLDENYKLTVS